MVCNAATSYARAPVSLVAPLLPRIPQRIYSSLSGVVSPLFGRSGWTDGLAGSSDRGPGALERAFDTWITGTFLPRAFKALKKKNLPTT